MEVTLALAILLCGGFVAAKAAQFMRLPSVTGYICAGVILGPSCLHAITEQALEQQLGHFTQIALMLIAFGIGEHLDLRSLRRTARNVGYIGLGETSGAFLLVGIGSFGVAQATSVGEAWVLKDFIALGLLLGAVSVATAPAATLHVMRELGARGPLTSTLMAVVAVDDGLAIIYFGLAMTAARRVVGAGGEGFLLGTIGECATEIIGSLMLGVAAGLTIDWIVHRLRRRGEMLTVGLAFLLLAGEAARGLHWSPLLTGMATGFTIVNRDRRDVRLFRAINDFEPPIYALFFTLAGAHLRLSALAVAGYLGAVYTVLRVVGKMGGASLGASLSAAPTAVRRWLGLALVPQAGVAIGLVFLIQGDANLQKYSSVITPVVLAAVVLSELVGPLGARIAVLQAGEAEEETKTQSRRGEGGAREETGFEAGQLVPWTWDLLEPAAKPQGSVIFGVSDPRTVAGLARFAAVLSDYHRAQPLAVRVRSPEMEDHREERSMTQHLFAVAETEGSSLGYKVTTYVERAAGIAGGLISAAEREETQAIVLGHPLERTSQGFARVVDEVARRAPCPVIVVRFAGVLHTERILVPVGSVAELDPIREVVQALAHVGPHQITLLHLLPPDAGEETIQAAEKELEQWTQTVQLPGRVDRQAIPTQARVDTITQEAAWHDLLVMAATPMRGLPRVFFGSLAEDVAHRCSKPMLMVHRAKRLGNHT